ncbi:MAG: ABC transporter substrate-binding protein, partial [Brucella intermedia]
MKIARLALMGGLLATALDTGSSTARDLTVVSWGGNYQDA